MAMLILERLDHTLTLYDVSLGGVWAARIRVTNGEFEVIRGALTDEQRSRVQRSAVCRAPA